MSERRIITRHAVNGVNEALEITAGPPGPGGASHCYEITGFNTASNPAADGFQNYVQLAFQNGPLPERGPNGVTHEALLAIVADRLEGFQAGPYACEENALALDAVILALAHLKGRTLARLARGVEGSMNV